MNMRSAQHGAVVSATIVGYVSRETVLRLGMEFDALVERAGRMFHVKHVHERCTV